MFQCECDFQLVSGDDPPMASPGFSELRRFLTLENAVLYRQFYDTVVVEGKTVAAVSKNFGYGDQSRISKTISILNRKAIEFGGTQLVWQSKDKRWLSTPLGSEFYEFCREIENKTREMEEFINSYNDKPIIRVGVNSFSFLDFLKIEEIVRNNNPGLEYKRMVFGHRSSELLHKVPKDENLDIYISEYTDELRSVQRREHKLISIEPIYLLSNYPLMGIYDDEGRATIDVTWRLLKQLPLVIGDTRSFLDILLTYTDTISNRISNNNEKKDYIWDLDVPEKKNIIRQEYNVVHESTSVHLVMDMFIKSLSGNKAFIYRAF